MEAPTPSITVLYVEDNLPLREVLSEHFARLMPWAQVAPCASIPEAIQFINSGNTPAAIISDGYLGEYRGNETAIKLQTELDTLIPEVPFAVLTGNPHDFPTEAFIRPPLIVAEKGGTQGPRQIAKALQERLQPQL